MMKMVHGDSIGNGSGPTRICCHGTDAGPGNNTDLRDYQNMKLEMIKINWNEFIADRVWFGWRKMYTPEIPRHLFRDPNFKPRYYVWRYSRLWSDRLVPVYNRYRSSPDWWIRFTNWTGMDD